MCAHVTLQYSKVIDDFIVTADYIQNVLQRTCAQSAHGRLSYMQSFIGHSVTGIANLAAAVS